MALLNRFSYDLNADKHSPASSARSTKRRVRGGLCQWELKAPTDRSRSGCVHEQVAKLGPVSRAAGMDCECPLYWKNTIKKPEHLDFKGFQALNEQGMRESNSH